MLFLIGSGITFILKLLLLFYWGGVTGTSFINRSLKGVGRAVGFTFIIDCYWVGNQDLVKVSCLYWGCRYSHHLPEVDGRFLGWRGEGGEVVLVLLWPCAGGQNHLLGVSGHRHGSGLLLGISRTTEGWSTCGMREVAVASGGSAPTSSTMAGNAVRGGDLSGVCTLSHSDYGHRAGFS